MAGEDVHPTIREAYCIWNTFRCLGFKSDDLFFELDPEKVCIVLRPGSTTEQAKIFVVTAGPYKPASQSMMVALWRRFVERLVLGEFDKETLDKWWEESSIGKAKVGFVTSLYAKGIIPPGPE